MFFRASCSFPPGKARLEEDQKDFHTTQKECSGLDSLCRTLGIKLAAEMKLIMKKTQLEMSFQACNPCRPSRGNQRRPSRAHWWFSQMRQVVDGAFDWKSAPQPRPEQTFFRLASGR